MVANHEMAGGQPAPPIYEDLLDCFSFLSFEIFVDIFPGVGCLDGASSYAFSLYTGK